MKYSNIISTRAPQLLPEIHELKKLCQSIALLEAIFVPEICVQEYGFSQNGLEGRDLAIIDNGQGDNCFIVFGAEGVFITGCGHESIMTPFGEYGQMKEIFEDVPDVFNFAFKHNVLATLESSFCIWKTIENPIWQVGNIPFPFTDDDEKKTGLDINEDVMIDYIDGSGELLYLLNGDPKDFQERIIDDAQPAPNIDILNQIYAHKPLTQSEVDPKIRTVT